MSGYQHREIRLGRHRLDTKPNILPEREKKNRDNFEYDCLTARRFPQFEFFVFPFKLNKEKGSDNVKHQTQECVCIYVRFGRLGERGIR